MFRTVIAAVALAPAIVSTAAPSPAAAAPAERVTTATARPYSVVARIDRDTVVAGHGRVRITGRVRPMAPGQTVVLQQRRDGRKKWTTSSTGRIRQSGSFVLSDRPSKPGVRYYRVLKPASAGWGAGTSKQMRLEVYEWQLLADRPAGAHAGVLFHQKPLIGTEPYPESIVTEVSGNPGFVEYTLGGKCRSLRATYGLTDDSASGATGSVTILVDSVVVSTQGLRTGDILRGLPTDVRDAFRIRLELTSTVVPAGWSAVGTPEVLCLD